MQRREVAAGPDQDGALTRRRARVDGRPDLPGDPGALLLPGQVQGHHGLAQLRLVRRRLELHDAVPRPQDGGDLVGQAQQAPAGALVERERERRCRPPVGRREVLGEPVEVGHRRTTPAVDGLAGVADRGHRMAATEQADEHPALRDAGVLVLVEQHDDRPLALGRPDLRERLGEPGRQGHLVAEVDRVEVGLGLPVGADQRRELRPLAGRGGHRPQVVAVALAARAAVVLGAHVLDLAAPVLVPGQQLLGGDQVL